MHQYRFGTNGFETTRGWPELITETRRNRSASVAAGEKKLLSRLKRTKFKDACRQRGGEHCVDRGDEGGDEGGVLRFVELTESVTQVCDLT